MTETKKKTTDDLVLELFNKVKNKQKEITAAEKPRWVTSATIGYNPDIATDRINLQTVTDIKKLVDIYGYLTNKFHSWASSCEDLGLKIKFTWMGYSFSDWEKDIKSRVAQIEVNAKKKELADLESRLNQLISVEQRRELELAAIQELLGE